MWKRQKEKEKEFVCMYTFYYAHKNGKKKKVVMNLRESWGLWKIEGFGKRRMRGRNCLKKVLEYKVLKTFHLILEIELFSCWGGHLLVPSHPDS